MDIDTSASLDLLTVKKKVMQNTMFYQHVSKWIKSCQSNIHLEWVRRFVNNHFHDKATKEALNTEIDLKINQITATYLDHSRYDFE